MSREWYELPTEKWRMGSKGRECNLTNRKPPRYCQCGEALSPYNNNLLCRPCADAVRAANRVNAKRVSGARYCKWGGQWTV